MIAMRAFPGLLAAAAFVAAGCGSQPVASSDESASLAPKDAALYFSIDIDPDSEQWRKLDALADRAPGARKAFDELLSEAAQGEELSLPELQKVAGPEVVAVLPAGADEAVLLTQTDDRDELERVAREANPGSAFSEVDGWVAVGESQQALDAYTNALDAGRLDEVPAFTEAMAELPEDTLVRGYVDGRGLAGIAQRASGAAGSALGGLPGVASPTGPFGTLGTIALGVWADDDSVRFEGSATQEGLTLPAFDPTLLDRVPADALVAAAFKGGEALERQLRDAIGRGGAQLEQGLGISVERIARLFAGEGVFYLRPGAPIPEITVVLDGAGADGTLLLTQLVGSLAGGFGASPKLESDVVDGVQVQRLELTQGIALTLANLEGDLFVTTGAGALRAFRSPGSKLVDTPAFSDALADVGFERTTSGLLYADVDALVPLIEGLAALGSGSTDLEGIETLEAIDAVAFNVSAAGGKMTFKGSARVG